MRTSILASLLVVVAGPALASSVATWRTADGPADVQAHCCGGTSRSDSIRRKPAIRAARSTVGLWKEAMDQDRVDGDEKQMKGSIKEAIGKVTGDVKIENEGKADKAEGKVQSTIGGLKDTLRGK